MKNFFKKVWEAIKVFFCKIGNILTKIPNVCLLFCILGMFLAAVFAIVFPKVAEWPIVPVFFAGVFVVFARVFLGKETDLECCLYYLGGALLIQILCWIA